MTARVGRPFRAKNNRITKFRGLQLVASQMFVGCNVRHHEIPEFERIADIGRLCVRHWRAVAIKFDV
jgi:hypothetical protein